MIMPREKEPSPLVGAARALDAELERLEALAAKSQTEPLNSQRNMERAARTLGGVTELEETIRGALARLVEAMEGVGARQNAAMEALGARAKELEARFGSFKELVARRDQLGAHGQRVNESIRQLLATGGGAAAIGPNIAATLAEVRGISEESEALFAEAKERGFNDLASEVDSVRQQLLSLRKKLGNLEAQQGGAGGEASPGSP